MKLSFKHMFASTIKATKNPMAPIITQEASGRVNALGGMLGGICNEAVVNILKDRLLKDFDDDELNKLCATPEFSMALAALLAQSIIEWVRGVSK